MSQIAEANVITRGSDTGSGDPQLGQYPAVVNAALPRPKRVPRWIVRKYTDTRSVLPEQQEEDYLPPQDHRQIEASWNRFLNPPVHRARIASLTRATNITSTPISSTGFPREASKRRAHIPGKQITPAEARTLAIEVLKDAKEELRRERADEARFLASLWEDDES